MADEQLKLFSIRSIFQERFDNTFFRRLPECAGIYLMCDAHERVIYVGKAKNLRQRVGSYRYAHEHCSRKTARLLARVANIRWQLCASEEAALLEENRLLRELRPRFNRVNTWPKASRFVRVSVDDSGVQLGLATEPDGECYGAFKGASRETFGALLRLLCTLGSSYDALPRTLLLERSPVAYQFAAERATAWLDSLRSFLRGDSEEMLRRFSPADDCPFHAAFRQADILVIEYFFRIGPQRNRVLRQRFGAGEIIAQHELDDLLVRQRATQREGGRANAT